MVKPVRQRPDIYVDRESDKPIVVKKLANKVSKKKDMAELAERRGLTERNGEPCRA